MRASCSSTSNSRRQRGQRCAQALTVSVFTAMTGLETIGVRWPQPVTWQGPCLAWNTYTVSGPS